MAKTNHRGKVCASLDLNQCIFRETFFNYEMLTSHKTTAKRLHNAQFKHRKI